MQQRDYILDEIDRAARFIAKIVTTTNAEANDQAALDQTLSI